MQKFRKSDKTHQRYMEISKHRKAAKKFLEKICSILKGMLSINPEVYLYYLVKLRKSHFPHSVTDGQTDILNYRVALLLTKNRMKRNLTLSLQYYGHDRNTD